MSIREDFLEEVTYTLGLDICVEVCHWLVGGWWAVGETLSGNGMSAGKWQKLAIFTFGQRPAWQEYGGGWAEFWGRGQRLAEVHLCKTGEAICDFI